MKQERATTRGSVMLRADRVSLRVAVRTHPVPQRLGLRSVRAMLQSARFFLQRSPLGSRKGLAILPSMGPLALCC